MMKVVSFLIPLAAWCLVSYVPWVWHPQFKITDQGGTERYAVGNIVDRAVYKQEQQELTRAGKALMQGTLTNPIFLPQPHEVARSIYLSFTTEPARRGAPWLHERILQSVSVLAKAFALAVLIAVPLGLLCGTFDLFSKLIEPFVDFFRYMPAPAFGGLMVSIFSMGDAPKVAIIFIGLFFNLLLVTANTTRYVDGALLEAAQTLGATRWRLLTRVVLPGALPMLFNDLRITLGFGWIYLAVAEIVGAFSGLSEFIDQNRKFRNYANVYAGIFIFGAIGFITDQILA
ncbi:MAG: ABC transporter permease, partial [Burkholderiales bacterium]|nr:ABC transporter permease [Phycisphaerae bacterium]